MLVMVRGAVPVLVSVKVCVALVVSTNWLAKVSDAGDSVAVGAPVPVPVRAATCGPPVALSLTVKLPVCVPFSVGVKVTLMLQLAPAAIVLPQELVWA
ncbi:MAG TPA: hypothetical protein VKJ01_16015 [Candidatus Solibacter sp.]|nr:hypothetical protein [Candidatus Solibacter sp.]